MNAEQEKNAQAWVAFWCLMGALVTVVVARGCG